MPTNAPENSSRKGIRFILLSPGSPAFLWAVCSSIINKCPTQLGFYQFHSGKSLEGLSPPSIPPFFLSFTAGWPFLDQVTMLLIPLSSASLFYFSLLTMFPTPGHLSAYIFLCILVIFRLLVNSCVGTPCWKGLGQA